MQLILPLKPFAAAFRLVADVCPTRTPKEVLRNVHFAWKSDGTGVLTATDSEIVAKAPVSGLSAGFANSALLPVEKMLKILRETKGESISLTFNMEHTKALLKTDQSRFDLPLSDETELPIASVPDINDDALGVTGQTFLAAVRNGIWAVDTEGARYAMGGACLNPDDTMLNVVTTNGRVMVHTPVPMTLAGEYPDNAASVVPLKTCKLLLKLFHEIGSEDDIKIQYDTNSIAFECDGLFLSSQFVMGRFPTWRSIIPDILPAGIAIPASALGSAMRQASVMIDLETRGFAFNFGSGLLNLQAESSQGTSSVDLPIPYNGPDRTVRMNPEFLQGFLTATGAETVELALSEDDEGPLYASSGSSRCVIMPYAT